MMWRAAIWLALFPWLAVMAIVGHVRAQGADDVNALSRQVTKLYQEGKHAEAVPIAVRALALAERLHGTDHAEAGSALHNLALLYGAQQRHGDAEPLYRRALTIKEKALGPDHPSVATSLNNLAFLYRHADRDRSAARGPPGPLGPIRGCGRRGDDAMTTDAGSAASGNYGCWHGSIGCTPHAVGFVCASEAACWAQPLLVQTFPFLRVPMRSCRARGWLRCPRGFP